MLQHHCPHVLFVCWFRSSYYSVVPGCRVGGKKITSSNFVPSLYDLYEMYQIHETRRTEMKHRWCRYLVLAVTRRFVELQYWTIPVINRTIKLLHLVLQYCRYHLPIPLVPLLFLHCMGNFKKETIFTSIFAIFINFKSTPIFGSHDAWCWARICEQSKYGSNTCTSCFSAFCHLICSSFSTVCCSLLSSCWMASVNDCRRQTMNGQSKWSTRSIQWIKKDDITKY